MVMHTHKPFGVVTQIQGTETCSKIKPLPSGRRLMPPSCRGARRLTVSNAPERNCGNTRAPTPPHRQTLAYAKGACPKSDTKAQHKPAAIDRAEAAQDRAQAAKVLGAARTLAITPHQRQQHFSLSVCIAVLAV